MFFLSMLYKRALVFGQCTFVQQKQIHTETF